MVRINTKFIENKGLITLEDINGKIYISANDWCRCMSELWKIEE